MYTGWSGPTEFAGADDVKIGGDDMEPVHPGYGWEQTAQWAACDVPMLRRALRNAEPPQRRIHPPGYYRQFGSGAVGDMMSWRLQERFPEAWTEMARVGGFG